MKTKLMLLILGVAILLVGCNTKPIEVLPIEVLPIEENNQKGIEGVPIETDQEVGRSGMSDRVKTTIQATEVELQHDMEIEDSVEVEFKHDMQTEYGVEIDEKEEDHQQSLKDGLTGIGLSLLIISIIVMGIALRIYIKKKA